MYRALKTASTGMQAQQTQIDIIANNMANVNTVGFKRARGEFQDLYYQQLRAGSEAVDQGTAEPVGLEIGQGVRVMASQKMFGTGDMMQTSNPYDLAIEGNGFFKVNLPDGSSAYTRAGQFRVNGLGQLVNPAGYTLDGGIEIPSDATEVIISREGIVQAKRPDEVEYRQLGEIRVSTVQNPAGMQSMGRGLFRATQASGQVIDGIPGSDGLGEVVQGQLESSNVKVVEEMIDLISAQRAYEMNSKVVQSTDQMLRDAANMR